MKKLFSLVLLSALIFGIYGIRKPLPDGMNFESRVYNVPESSVEFFYDAAYLNKDGQRESKQEIFDEIFKMIKGAKKLVLLDMFLFNDFQGKKSENNRKLSSELTELLIEKKKADPKLEIIVVSDPVNTIYGGYKSPQFNKLEEAGVKIVNTIDDIPSMIKQLI